MTRLNRLFAAAAVGALALSAPALRAQEPAAPQQEKTQQQKPEQQQLALIAPISVTACTNDGYEVKADLALGAPVAEVQAHSELSPQALAQGIGRAWGEFIATQSHTDIGNDDGLSDTFMEKAVAALGSYAETISEHTHVHFIAGLMPMDDGNGGSVPAIYQPTPSASCKP